MHGGRSTLKAQCHADEKQLEFTLSEVPSPCLQAVLELGYSEAGNVFRRTLPMTAPHDDRVCRNFERYAEDMVLQTARVQTIPWEQGLSAFLELVEPHQLDWWVGGSAALAIRGFNVIPRDFDLITDDQSAQRLGVLLADYLIEPVTQVDWFCKWWGRAFLQTRIEWVGDVDERADQPAVSDFGPTAARRLETVMWQGHPIRVPPLELQLEVSKRRGLRSRVEQIERRLSATELDE